MNESQIFVIFQLVYESGQMIYNHKALSFTKEQWDNFANTLPQKWCTENDQISVFTWYSDETYICEKTKTYYDFNLKDYQKRSYNYTEPSNEEAALFFNSLKLFWDQIRALELVKQKEILRDAISKEFNFITIKYRSIRDRLLMESDWTQLTDVSSNMSDDESSRWRQYRQYLRDMPQTDAWQNKEYLKIEFPLTPVEFEEAFPGEEYLSDPRHFINHITLAAKDAIVRVVELINLGETNEALDEFQDTRIGTEVFNSLMDTVNNKLQTIDNSLKIELKVSTQTENYM